MEEYIDKEYISLENNTAQLYFILRIADLIESKNFVEDSFFCEAVWFTVEHCVRNEWSSIHWTM